jgi:hypothetical protein
VTTQTAMTVEKVFDGYDFRTNQGREGSSYYFPGHLAVEEIADKYFGVYPEHRTRFPYRIDPDSIRHAWHVFTPHEDDCYLASGADEYGPFGSDDYFLCSCTAAHNRECDGRGHSP